MGKNEKYYRKNYLYNWGKKEIKNLLICQDVLFVYKFMFHCSLLIYLTFWKYDPKIL